MYALNMNGIGEMLCDYQDHPSIDDLHQAVNDFYDSACGWADEQTNDAFADVMNLDRALTYANAPGYGFTPEMEEYIHDFELEVSNLVGDDPNAKLFSY